MAKNLSDGGVVASVQSYFFTKKISSVTLVENQRKLVMLPVKPKDLSLSIDAMKARLLP